MADERRDVSRPAGGITTVLGGRGRAGMGAFAAGLAGTAAFTASLIVHWWHVTMGSTSLGLDPETTFTVGLDGSAFAHGYVAGALGLLALLGLALARPDLARQLRTVAEAVGLGLVGVLIAINNQLQDVMSRFYGFRVGFPAPVPAEIQEILDATTYAPLPGLFLAFAAVLLLVAAVWLAGGPSRPTNPGLALAPADPATTSPPTAVGPTIAASPATAVSPAADPAGHTHPSAGVRVGYVDDLTVTASDVIDPGTQPDILRH